MDYTEQREQLINKLRSEGIRSEKVLAAISRTPRERFVLEEFQHRAYENNALPINVHQTISQPYIVALMTEALQLNGQEAVLEIGTGSGYQAAVLSELAKKVVTVERVPELAGQAKQLLTDLGYTNIECHESDGTLGWEPEAPYDAIIVTAAAPKVPRSLLRQLKEEARLIIPTGSQDVQNLYCYQRRGDHFSKQKICGCRFVKLIGQEGWIPTQSD